MTLPSQVHTKVRKVCFIFIHSFCDRRNSLFTGLQSSPTTIESIKYPALVIYPAFGRST
jgi:hypothetical protein